jgi:hypothetical protein
MQKQEIHEFVIQYMNVQRKRKENARGKHHIFSTGSNLRLEESGGYRNGQMGSFSISESGIELMKIHQQKYDQAP